MHSPAGETETRDRLSRSRASSAIPNTEIVMKYVLIGFVEFTLSSALAETLPPIEIRFCPASAVHTYPLESRREVNSLLLQNVAVLNHSASAFKIKAVTIELLQSGEVTDSKRLEALALQRF